MASIRNSKKDLKDRLGALMVYLELKERTNENTFISSLDMTKSLEKRYGKENVPSHNTVARYLKAMKDYSDILDIDVRKGNSRQGYCLASRESSEWEINLFVESIISSKTLSSTDKEYLISKCFRHLGIMDYEEQERIISYISDTKKTRFKKRVENNDFKNIISLLTDAIKENKMVVVTSDALYGRKTISPYRIFSKDNDLYLMYGYYDKKQKYRVSCVNIIYIENVEKTKRRTISLESIDNFKDGIDEAKFRKDPLGYIRQKEAEKVLVQISKTEKNEIEKIKTILRKEFKENVEFVHQKEYDMAYIDASSKNIMQFLFEYSDVCILIGPDKWKERFKSKLARTYYRYTGNIIPYSEMRTFVNDDRYIEKDRSRIKARKDRKPLSEEEKNKNYSVNDIKF